MSTAVLLRGFFVFLICGVVAYCSYFRNDRETSAQQGKTPRYANYLPAYALPEFVLLVLLFGLWQGGAEATFTWLVSWGFGTFLHVSLFYVVLIVIMPFFRRYFTAVSCAELWLLPTLFYVVEHSFMELPGPALVLESSREVIIAAAIVWLAGFVLIFLWQSMRHLLFRRSILRDAVPVTDAAVRAVWDEERKKGNFKKDYMLVQSPAVRTPLSIGLFRRSMRVVLPLREYTAGELHLIFRHELVHIGREDNRTKLYMLFCTAACWFNPLMWLAMRKSAEDMELSCDEAVLRDEAATPARRREYAELVLQTAGDERGFTTCLSASAKSLRYRLHNMVRERKVRNGGLAVGAMLFLFMMTGGYVAVGYSCGSAGECIFSAGEPQDYTITNVSGQLDGHLRFCDGYDGERLREYLMALPCMRITGNYSYDEEDGKLVIIVQGPEKNFGLTLTEHALTLVPLHGRQNAVKYYLQEAVNWAEVQEMLGEKGTSFD